MALHYNLAKVYALSDNDLNFIMQVITLFTREVPDDLLHIKKAIQDKDYQMSYNYANKIKPSLDLMGMNVAYDENLQVIDWALRKGKRKEIKDIFKSIERQVLDAVYEINKDFEI